MCLYQVEQLLARSFLRGISALSWVILIATLLLIYRRTAVDLADDWWNMPEASQGLLVPPLATYVAWKRRRLTLEIPAAPSLWGLLWTAAACGLFLIGRLGAEC